MRVTHPLPQQKQICGHDAHPNKYGRYSSHAPGVLHCQGQQLVQCQPRHATATPSGMLCNAMAMAKLRPILLLLTDAKN
eukprot:CAMPEP_0202364420 /NCGR_PEP_ID=MMETSP1126-20121109/15835_1 /ASSEMBLY_ACC=CAM_ASM_000457 /TAXON_ID=3047 /ORGANISM="Dunaliella tertiolecta, Strain CCMP1320" /LENGTH=78 /DNA_ID=CAMNT_0048959059 /DNA_START=226 /DNA_END=459 /DNA_ORIENTATION=+